MTPAVVPLAPPAPYVQRLRRVVLADPQRSRRDDLDRALAALGPAVVVEAVTSRAALEMALREDDVDLVVTTSRLGRESALSVLARARAGGSRTPFIVYSEMRGSLVRVLVSDAEEALLSSRVLGWSALMELANTLIERRRWP